MDYIEDQAISFEEYDQIKKQALEMKLADPEIEIVGSPEFDNELGAYMKVR